MKKKFYIFITALFLIFGSFLTKPVLSITVKEEEDLSRKFLVIVKKHFPVVEDSIVVDYINRLGKKLLSAIPPQPFTYHFYVLNEHVFNAFATPAGHIFIHSGLIEALQSEDELAGIMAHEIAHVTNRHISQKIDRSKKVQLATLAGMVAGAFLGAGGAGAAASSALSVGSMAAGQSVMLSYSRDDEFEADSSGLSILTQAGYDGSGLLSGLKIIRSKQWFGSEQIPTYLSTHPASEERIINLTNWIESKGQKPQPPSEEDTYTFLLVRNRLAALYGDETAAIQRFKTEVDKDPQNPMAHYGYGLILARTGNREEAIQDLRKALEKRAFDPYFLTELGRVYFLDGRYEKALQALEGAVSISPNYAEGLFYLARTYSEKGEFSKAASLLETIIRERRDYTMAYYALGEAYGKQGKGGYAHYYLGLFYWQRRDAKNAVFHLQRAAKMVEDPEKTKKIEKMLKKLNKEANP